LLALQIVQVTLRENNTSSAPIANKGRFNFALLNQLVLGSSAGAKQFLESGTDRNTIRTLDDRGSSDRLSPSIVHGLLPSLVNGSSRISYFCNRRCIFFK
jgi:hypothetical protein